MQLTKKEILLANKYMRNHSNSWKVKEVHVHFINTLTCSDWQGDIFSFI